MTRAHVVVADAEPLDDAGPEVLHEDVGVARELEDDLATRRAVCTSTASDRLPRLHIWASALSPLTETPT